MKENERKPTDLLTLCQAYVHLMEMAKEKEFDKEEYYERKEQRYVIQEQDSYNYTYR